jgi:hypothetical protein
MEPYTYRALCERKYFCNSLSTGSEQQVMARLVNGGMHWPVYSRNGETFTLPDSSLNITNMKCSQLSPSLQYLWWA